MSDSKKNIAAQPQKAPAPGEETMRRVQWLKASLLVFFAVVAVRLVQIQVVDAGRYQEIARRQYEVKVPLLAMRGNIYDRNGKILVSSAMAVSYAADPKVVGAKAEVVADRFAKVFGESNRETYLARLRKKDSRFVWLERRASQQTIARLNVQQLDGVIQANEPQRIYHYDHVAGQLLGFTDIDNNGLSGIELQFDRYLKGRDGYIVMQRDGMGRKRPTVDYPRVEPVNGNNIVLTIDLECQAIAEEELRRAIERNNAESGVVVMLDPRTGEVLAMANAPSINPNRYQTADPDAARNRAITDVFEPGSLFKIVTVAAALEHHVVSPTQKFFAENGVYRVPGRSQPITDVHKYGMLTLREATELSSNIVMAKVATLIGAERLYTMARNFGFGTPTGIELLGEVSGQLKKPNQWSGTTLTTMAYGYEVSATPLQLAAAYAAIANGGVLMKPFLVKQILSEHNEVITETTPQAIRRVVSQATADTLRSFLRGVVERGTGVNSRSTVVAIAGKTGTTRKLVGGSYSMQAYKASFVGMFPADNPQVVCLVVLDNPKTQGYYGAYTSAPVVKGIAEKVTTTSGTMTMAEAPLPTRTDLVATPDVRAMALDAATSTLAALDLHVTADGKGSVVVQQTPAPGQKVARGTSVRLVTADMATTAAGGNTVVPDLRGLSLRRALNRLALARLGAYVEGSGIVVGQSMAPGQEVKPGTRIVIRCSPKRNAPVASL
jgi:cell division protein FtsI (penicillin-binding protein 3)